MLTSGVPRIGRIVGIVSDEAPLLSLRGTSTAYGSSQEEQAPVDPEPTWYGHSIGHFRSNTWCGHRASSKFWLESKASAPSVCTSAALQAEDHSKLVNHDTSTSGAYSRPLRAFTAELALPATRAEIHLLENNQDVSHPRAPTKGAIRIDARHSKATLRLWLWAFGLGFGAWALALGFGFGTSRSGSRALGLGVALGSVPSAGAGCHRVETPHATTGEGRDATNTHQRQCSLDFQGKPFSVSESESSRLVGMCDVCVV